MKIKNIYMTLISLLVLFSAFSTLANAKELNLYDQPKDGSKVIGKLDSAKGMVPIFTQPDGTWMKVGDPQNGNVGWVKSTDMGQPSSYSVSQQVVNDGKGVPRSYQVVRFGDIMNTQDPLFQNYMKQLQNNNPPKNANEAIQKVVNDINSFYIQQFKQMPVIVPMVVMPAAPVPVQKK